MSSRLKSGIWVAALLRHCAVEGTFATVLNKGADEAGAVYVVLSRRDKTCALYGPAPGEAYDENGDRRFYRVGSAQQDWPATSANIARLRRIDPDIWVVEVESETIPALMHIITD